ncbi:hypothetical protein G6F43_012533 [Rhizopus delemar]|nr:hypothetical protein G6F43_012533 [Rhizopus delemar]
MYILNNNKRKSDDGLKQGSENLHHYANGGLPGYTQSLQDEQILDKFQVQVEAIVKEVEEMTINLWKSKDAGNLAVGEFLNGKAVIDRLARNEELKHAETCFRKIF